MSDRKERENLGQSMLLLTRLSLRTISDDLGISRASVSQWKRALNLPSEKYRAEMLRLYKIPTDAWDRPVSELPKVERAPDHRVTKEKGRPVELDSEPLEEADTTPDYPDPPEDGASVLEIARHSLACVRYDLEHRPMTAAARSKARADELRTLSLVAKLEEKEELSEPRYVRDHPSWKALRDVILNALKPYPEASQAVVEAIESLTT